MNINREILFGEYKNIVRTCIVNSYPLPVLLKEYKIPIEYQLPMSEKERLFNNLSREQVVLLGERLEYRSSIIENIRLGKSGYESVDEYYESELNEFLYVFPQYAKIIEDTISDK